MNFLKLKEIDAIDLDSPECTIIHGEIIQKKKFLKSIYIDWYQNLKLFSNYKENGTYLELGSGGGFLKSIMPRVITSDVMKLPNCDMVISAEKMPFDNNSVDSILMIDVLHHIPEPELFFIEAKRILKVNGTIIMSEPWNTGFSRLIYKNLHHEPFDVMGSWKIPDKGPLSGANGALPWIIFQRDKNLFKSKFPEFDIEFIKPHTPFRYLLSGGVSFKQLVPSFMFGIISKVERLLIPNYFSMFAYISIRKKF